MEFHCSPLRLIFLDFDGVLHPRSLRVIDQDRGKGASIKNGALCWLPVLESALERQCNVRIVVHSDWRLRYRDFELREMLGLLGERFLFSVPEGPRWRAINCIISAKRPRSWLILDDTIEEFPRPLPRELLICEPELGLSEMRVQEALKRWLNYSALELVPPMRRVEAAEDIGTHIVPSVTAPQK